MMQANPKPPYTLSADEKTASVMVYTATAIYWGDIVVKEMIRVSTWLRTNSAPGRVCLYGGRAVLSGILPAPRPAPFQELHVAASQILMFHLIPPARDPLDYDPNEPNRMMNPVSVLVSNFRVDGLLRLSARSDLASYFEVNRETFTSIYDARITSLINPAFGTISVPYLIVRQEASVFAVA